MTRAALSTLDDWELEFGDQDVRGWPIQDASGSQLGTVQDMIVNTDTEFVDALLTDDGREIPVSEIQIGDHSVLYRAGSAAGSAALSTDTVTTTDSVTTTAAATDIRPEMTEVESSEPLQQTRGDTTFRVRRHEESLSAEKRPVQAGEVEIRKEVREEERSIDVPVMREEVQVSRRSVSDQGQIDPDPDAFQETVIRVPLMEEDVEVRKEARVVEEIEVDKVARQETERLTDTVRRERVDITGDLDRSSEATPERSDER